MSEILRKKVTDSRALRLSRSLTRYFKDNEDRMMEILDTGADFADGWFGAPSPELDGLSPEEYVKKNWPGELSFRDAADVLLAFVQNSRAYPPTEIKELFLSFPESEAWIGERLEECVAYFSGDWKQDAFTEWGEMTEYCSDLAGIHGNSLSERQIGLLMRLLDLSGNPDYETVTDAVCGELAGDDAGYDALLGYLQKSDTMNMTEQSVLSRLSYQERRSEEFYRQLRSRVKKEESREKLELLLECVRDYGDARAVSFLRTKARQLSARLDDADMAPEERKDCEDLFNRARYVIKELGGNIDDL